MKIAEIRKALAAVAGAVASVAATGLLPEPWDTWATVFVGVVTAALVYQMPNELPSKPPVSEDGVV